MAKSPLPDLPGVNKLSKEYKQFITYLTATDAEQYDIVRDRWAKINWHLLDKCDQAVDALQKGESPAKISPLIISAGIGFDKLYSKRTETSKPLSFPAPLLEMVRKGLKMRSQVPVASMPEMKLPSDSLAPVPAAEPVLLTSPEQELNQSDTGGVACAEPEVAGRGHGPSLSRCHESDPTISQEQKNEVLVEATPGRSHAKNKARQGRSVQVEKGKRHAAKATRAAMVEAMRERIRAEVPYQRPAEPGGIV